MPVYVALIHKDKSSDFGVSFPDFPGCIAVGATLQEALEGAKEALEFHMEGMIEDGETIAESTGLDAIAKLPQAKGASSALVSVELPGKSVRVNITGKPWELDYIDRAAARSGVDRSAFMIAAARKLADDVLKEPGARYEVVTKSKSGRRVLAAKVPVTKKRAARRAHSPQ
jgi:predicted RNase H-like HicB family nuclease/uncharacterized protein (DUF1778 family)